MIVPDGQPADISKTSFAPVSSRPGGPSNSRPADMPPTYADVAAGRAPPSQDPHAHVPFYRYRFNEDGSAKRRFWAAFFVAIICYFLLTMLVRSIVELAGGHRLRNPHWTGPGSIAKDWPEFNSGEVKTCIDRANWPFSQESQTAFDQQEESDMLVDPPVFDIPSTISPPYSTGMTFKLPADADLLYFLSRGSLAYGSVKLDAAREGGDDVRVDVEVSYWTEAALERATVCKLERDSGKHGIGIFTPRSWKSRGMTDMLRFDVTVYLPVSTRGHAARIINSLQTDFSNFKHEITDLQGLVDFKSMDLRTSNAIIESESVYVENGSFRSSNGAISGSYNTSTSLKLTTSNARINAEVTLNSDSLSHPTELIMKTSNGLIDSSVNMYAVSGDGAKSAFTVQSTTSNSPLLLTFPAHPLNSLFTLDAKTSNSKANVALHPAFEGTFTLRTSNSRPSLNDERASDPTGGGRKRNVQFSIYGSGILEGRAWWGEWANKKSWAHVQSSNSPVTLQLKNM